MHDKINGKILRNNLDYIEQVEKLTKRLQYKHSISRNDLYSIVYTKERLSRIKDNSDENLKLNIDIAIKQLDMVLKAYSSEDISNILNKEYKHSKLDRQEAKRKKQELGKLKPNKQLLSLPKTALKQLIFCTTLVSLTIIMIWMMSMLGTKINESLGIWYVDTILTFAIIIICGLLVALMGVAGIMCWVSFVGTIILVIEGKTKVEYKADNVILGVPKRFSALDKMETVRALLDTKYNNSCDYYKSTADKLADYKGTLNEVIILANIELNYELGII